MQTLDYTGLNIARKQIDLLADQFREGLQQNFRLAVQGIADGVLQWEGVPAYLASLVLFQVTADYVSAPENRTSNQKFNELLAEVRAYLDNLPEEGE